ncbi:DUF485 domain-containing protein [Desulfonatronospira sp.]|uniref:DUF485 domain-containing protein n=1 Tax=Desulfonatronospira sp. TaxID=1962951 RepID=UPI0025C07778|nr:DUF485 domain-containing protein [Desulfonatronospira sp.]
MQQSPPPDSMDKEKFRRLVVNRWKVSLTLTAIMMLAYFGFILILAYAPHLLSMKIGEHMTLGIPVGIFVIVLAFILTGIYVFWSNSYYDKAVEEVLKSMRRK